MTTEPAPGDQLPPSGLTWGVKRSFIRYISGLPDGAVSATEGATIVESSLFNFVPDGGDFDVDTGTGVLRFRGDVRMAGHFGMMFVQILDPWLEFTTEGAALSTLASNEDGTGRDRVILGTLQPGSPENIDGSFVWQGIDVAISPQGSELFNGQYPAGQPMDPLFVRVDSKS